VKGVADEMVWYSELKDGAIKEEQIGWGSASLWVAVTTFGCIALGGGGG